jgi:diacylglycerol kinase family enzyme
MSADVEQAADRIWNGMPCPLDLGVVNGRRMAAVGGVGFDAECVQRLARKRKGHITPWHYAGPIFRTFMKHRFPRMRIAVDGDEVFRGQGLVIFGNIHLYATGLRILERACCNDGLLDVAIFPCNSRWRLLGHAWRVLRKRHLRTGGVIYRQVRHFTVQSEAEVPIEIDGDEAGQLPLEAATISGALRYLGRGRDGGPD